MPALNVPQAAFMQMPQKFRAFCAGYGSGKSWVGSTAMCARFWSQPGVNQAYYAPTYPHIRDIFFPTIEEVAHSLDLRVEIMESNKEVHFYSGAKYRGTTICRSMERPQSIIGYKVGHSMVDELDTMPQDKAKDAWRKILARMRWPDATNGIDVTTTPEGFRETHRLFVEELEARPHLRETYGLIQASTRDNERNLPPGYIQSLIDTYPAELIDAYIDGRFCNLKSGTVYRSYNRIRNASNETIQPRETLFIGQDFNVGRMASTIYVKRENGWHAVAELKDLLDTPDVIRVITERWKYAGHRIVVYPDASGGARKSVNASMSDIAMLEQAGFEVRRNSVNPAVRDRILSVNKQFETGKLWVNAKLAPTVAKCLEKQAYDDNGEPEKTGDDHMCFSGEQQIVVNGQLMAFKDIPSEGVVLCHDGVHRAYTNGGKKKDLARTLFTTLSNGDTIRCTEDHLFLTTSGWKRADNLIGELLCSQSLLVQLSRNTADSHIIFAEARIFKETALDFIEKFGQTLMEKSRLALSFITLTTIKQTIQSKISDSCLNGFIARIMGKIKQLCRLRQSMPQKNGTKAKMGSSGTSSNINQQSIYCTRKLMQYARTAVFITRRLIAELINFVQKIAQQKHERNLGLITRKELAFFVAQSFSKTNTQQRKHAEKNAVRVLTQEIAKREPVYCLTVPNFGMFSVSGVISSNCDAFGYPIAYEFPIIRQIERIRIGGT
jgi:hypothetical protein